MVKDLVFTISVLSINMDQTKRYHLFAINGNTARINKTLSNAFNLIFCKLKNILVCIFCAFLQDIDFTISDYLLGGMLKV